MPIVTYANSVAHCQIGPEGLPIAVSIEGENKRKKNGNVSSATTAK